MNAPTITPTKTPVITPSKPNRRIIRKPRISPGSQPKPKA
jgi:hypothetical protein